jgi:RNA polymerase sigma-70 factor (ECF subfamily)
LMVMRDVTLTDVDLLEAQASEAEVAFEMDEDTFRAFYERTARPLWGYLTRMTGSPQLADDLLQESYYRFLRVRINWESETHRRAYLYRIATNLVNDGRRRSKLAEMIGFSERDDQRLASKDADVSELAAKRTDLGRAMARLRPRDRALLWLAYAQGHQHAEIAQALGLKTASIKLLLFRARKRLAEVLRGAPALDPGGIHGDR